MRGGAPLLAVAALAATPVLSVEAPSGLAVEVHEVLYEVQPYSEELWVILRLLAPALATSEADPQADLDWACGYFGPDAVAAAPGAPAQIVVQLMDRALPRGVPAPEARQVFASYTLQDGACIWEDF